MLLFGKKETVLLDTSLSIGEFDMSADGFYRNIKTFPLNVRKGKLSVSVESSHPVDVALSDSSGKCIKFKDSVTNEMISAETSKKETVALILGVFPGTTADLKVRARME
jgi:hypothetical protein